MLCLCVKQGSKAGGGTGIGPPGDRVSSVISVLFYSYSCYVVLCRVHQDHKELQDHRDNL